MKKLFTILLALLAFSAQSQTKYNWLTQVKGTGFTTYSIASFDGTATDTIKSASTGLFLKSIAGSPGFNFTNIDSTDIANFAGKVRGLISATSPIGYNSITGIISADTTILATQADISVKLNSSDTTAMLLPYATDVDVAGKQATLVSGSNIKTYASGTLLGSGNVNPIISITLISGHSAAAITNQGSPEMFYNNSNRHITRYDLTGYTQVKLITRVSTPSASANTPKILLKYKTVASGFSTNVALYSTMGASEVESSLASGGCIDSGWINLVGGAAADIYIALLMSGGDGVEDPALGFTTLYFK